MTVKRKPLYRLAHDYGIDLWYISMTHVNFTRITRTRPHMTPCVMWKTRGKDVYKPLVFSAKSS